MKKLLLLSTLLFSPMPVMAQQVNNYAVCTQNQEVYRPGGYDQYGNYVPGGVSVQTYNVPSFKSVYNSHDPDLKTVDNWINQQLSDKKPVKEEVVKTYD